MKKKILAFACVLALLLPAVLGVTPSYATEGETPAAPAGTAQSGDHIDALLRAGGVVLNAMDTTAEMKIWDGVSEITTGAHAKRTMLTVHSAGENAAPAIDYVPADQISLIDYRTLSFLVEIAPQTMPDADYTVYVTLTADGGAAHSYGVSVPTGGLYTVSIDLSDDHYRSNLTKIGFSVSCNAAWEGVFHLGMLTAGEKIDAAVYDRYLTESFSPTDCTVTAGQDGALSVSIDAANASLESRIFVRDRASLADYNAVRAVFVNRSLCEQLRFQYTNIGDEAFSSRQMVSSDISAASGVQSCVFYLGDCAWLDAMRLTFYGVGGGEFTLLGLHLIRMPEEEAGGLGRLTRCQIDDVGENLLVGGALSSVQTVNYMNCRLNLYELAPSETPASVTDGREPVASGAMSIKFEFRVPLAQETLHPLRSKYAVIIESEDGTVFLPVGIPAYAENTKRLAANEAVVMSGFKGYYGVEEAICSAGFSSVVQDVYLDQLLSREGTGKLYATGGDYYYFDTAYLRILTENIRRHTLSGLSVTLRLLERTEDGGYTIPDCGNPAELRRLCAMVEFLSTRFGGGTNGCISGFVLGVTPDQFGLYGVTSDGLSSFIRNYATAMRVIYQVSSSYIANIRIYCALGIGGAYDPLTGMGDGACDPYFFAESVIAVLSQGGELPFYLYAQTAGNAADAVAQLSAFVLRMSKKYSVAPLQATVMYTIPDTASAEDAALDYLHAIVALEEAKYTESIVLAADAEIFSRLYPLIRYADTTDKEAIASALAALSRPTEIAETLAQQNVRIRCTNAVLHTIPDNIAGTFAYSNLSLAYDTSDWVSGGYCAHIMSRASSGGARVLSAEIAPTEGMYGGVIYTGFRPSDFSLTEMIAFSVTAETEEAGGDIDGILMFTGDGGTAEFPFRVRAGETTVIAADLSSLDLWSNVAAAAVLVRTDTMLELTVHDVRGYSSRYTDAEIARLRADRETTDTEKARQDMHDVLRILGILGGVIMTVTVVVLLSRYDALRRARKDHHVRK